MKIVLTLLKVAAQDALIIAGFMLIGCGVDRLSDGLGTAVTGIVGIVVVLLLFFLLFFSNAEIFKSVKNVYAWSLLSSLLTLAMVIPAVMYVVHNPCDIPLVANEADT